MKTTPVKAAVNGMTVGIALLMCGACDHLNSRLLTKHGSPHRREDAQEHWDAVRGEVKLQLARQHLQSGRLDEAEKVLAQVASISPREPAAFVLLARLRLEQGRFPEAREAVNLTKSLPSNDPEIDYLAGILAQRYGELDEALSCYSDAVKKAPNQPEYLTAKVETLVAMDQDVEALDVLSARLPDFDNHAAIRWLAARVCRSLGLRGPASEHARAALRQSSDDETLSIEAADIFLWAGRHQDVVNVLSPLHQSSLSTIWMPAKRTEAPTGGRPAGVPSAVRRMLATAYLELDQPRDALAVLEIDMRDEAIDAASGCLYVRAALALGELEAADNVLRRMRESGAQTAEVFALQAYVAMQRGDHEGCLAWASRALSQDDRFFMLWCLKGQAAEALGDDEVARDNYARVLEFDPGNQTAATRLAALSTATRCETSTDKLWLVPAESFVTPTWRAIP